MDLFKVTFALIIAICMIPIVPFADAQSGESIMAVRVSHDGKEYVVPYFILNAELGDVEVNNGSLHLSINSDKENGGLLELALPYGLLKQFWPEATGDKELSGLVVFVDGEQVPADITHVGSRFAIAFEFPAGSENVDIAGGSIPGEAFLLTLETPTRWVKPGESVEITGMITGGRDAEARSVRIIVQNAAGIVILDEKVVADPEGRFVLTDTIPEGAEGGGYEITAESDSSTLPKIKGYEFLNVHAPGFFKVSTEGKNENFFVSSNSSSYEPFFLKHGMTLGLLMDGPEEVQGETRLHIPHPLLGGRLAPVADIRDLGFNVNSDADQSAVDLFYRHSGQQDIIRITGTTAIPEFDLVLVSLILAATVAGTIVMLRSSLAGKLIKNGNNTLSNHQSN